MFFNASTVNKIHGANVSSSVRYIKTGKIALIGGYIRTDLSLLAAPCLPYNKSTLTNHSLQPSLHAYNHTRTTDWCMTAALLPAAAIFEASALPDSGQRYLSAHLLISPQLTDPCVCARAVSSPLVSLSDFAAPALASHRAHFPLHSVRRPFSEGGKRKTGKNKSEGGKDRNRNKG